MYIIEHDSFIINNFIVYILYNIYLHITYNMYVCYLFSVMNLVGRSNDHDLVYLHTSNLHVTEEKDLP